MGRLGGSGTHRGPSSEHIGVRFGQFWGQPGAVSRRPAARIPAASGIRAGGADFPHLLVSERRASWGIRGAILGSLWRHSATNMAHLRTILGEVDHNVNNLRATLGPPWQYPATGSTLGTFGGQYASCVGHFTTGRAQLEIYGCRCGPMLGHFAMIYIALRKHIRPE